VGYFAWPYRVLFSDAQAPDWNHFLSNFRFQCEAREHFVFAHALDTPEARAQCAEVILHVHEGYARNMAPVRLGDTVGVLMSYEEVTSSSMRCGFRVVRSDGTPVSCGFQRLVCLDKATATLRPFPDVLLRHARALREPLWSPPFGERVLSGVGVSALFDDEVVRIGRETATGARPGGLSRPHAGASVGPLVFQFTAADGADDVTAYTAGVRAAAALRARGAEPSVVVGRGVGEVAALVAAGALTEEAGLQAVAARARALAPARDQGGMTNLACPAEKARALLGALAPSSLEVAVVEGAEATVVAGRHADLDRLGALAAHLGVASGRVAGAPPLHSRLATRAAAEWTEALRSLPWRAPSRPIYSMSERALLAPEADLAGVLGASLSRPLPPHDALADLAARGGRAFVECGPAVLEAEGLARALEACGVRPRSASAPAAPASFAPGTTPIAVVGLGCVLPGAHDPEALWQRVLETRTCLTDTPPYDARDFLSEGALPVPDKTYACLGGWAQGFVPSAEAAGFRTVTQQHLATAIAQCLDGLASPRPASDRVQLLLGSTGDGCREYDESLLLASLAEPLPVGALDRERHAAWTRALESAVGRAAGEARDTTPWLLYREVGEALLGPGLGVLALDAACASALYALGTAVRALERGECDLALAGGAFHPGAANACLFAQFGGLSRTGSHPLDARADGVVFSEGTALLALKRLDDARAAGDRVHAVIRVASWSSDGRSPSVMEPREPGQVLAMSRAYAASGIDPASIQFLEAHATATPVGDAVEIGAAARVFPRGAAPLALGSVKAVFGHTGWAAGATSAIKMIKGLQSRTLPPQADFTAPNPRLAAENGRFEVPTVARPWPDNAGRPRRAAINGFGFGGSNAHLVLEEYDPGSAPVPSAAARPTEARPVAVVAAVSLLPAQGLAFAAGEVALPDSVLILPDVVDHMDRAQMLGLGLGARALAALPGWKALAEEAGVVVGIEGKTAAGVRADARVFRDRLRARIARDGSLSDADRDGLTAHVDSVADAVGASGPYTLLGLMPNVVAGRIANAFNLKGPNLVLDAHRGSLAAALRMAAGWVESGERPLVLAGAIQAAAHPAVAALVHASARVPETRPVGEAALLVALAPLALAVEKGWPTLAVLDARGQGDPDVTVGQADRCLLGAEGALEVVQALARVRAGAPSTCLGWASGARLTFLAAPAAETRDRPALTSAAHAGRSEAPWPA
jgi:3-oxoacyl-(acyl-carrier-protein) synthase/acyl-CoA thioesterase FadM